MQPSKGLHNQVVKIVVPYYTVLVLVLVKQELYSIIEVTNGLRNSKQNVQ